MKRLSLATLLMAIAVLGTVMVLHQSAVRAEPDSDPVEAGDTADRAAVERTRRKVHTLDSIYKHTIALITDKYVHDVTDFPAGSAAVALFANISAEGSHHVRLIDVTGAPYVPRNVARDSFEKEGVQRLRAGAEYHEQIVHQDGKPHLRALTAVPVVMDKCVMCHPHYADAAEGEAIGAISYIVPID